MDDWQSAPERGDVYRKTTADELLCDFEVTRTDADSGGIVVGYEHDTDPLDIAVPTIVAHCESTEPCALPPLYHAVDPTALSALFDDGRDGVSVTFRYAGYTVTVGDDVLSVRPAA